MYTNKHMINNNTNKVRTQYYVFDYVNFFNAHMH
jgi:hypothetical protein